MNLFLVIPDDFEYAGYNDAESIREAISSGFVQANSAQEAFDIKKASFNSSEMEPDNYVIIELNTETGVASTLQYNSNMEDWEDIIEVSTINKA